MVIKPRELRGEVCWVGIADSLDTLVSREMLELKAFVHTGFVGDRHGGPRLLDARETVLLEWGLPKGIEIANQRQFSAVSAEDFESIARGLELSAPTIPYGSLGENLVIRDIPRFSDLPRGTLLFFESTKGKRSAVLRIEEMNHPCKYPGQVLQERFPDAPRLEQRFPLAAHSIRGVVGIVYATGVIKSGDAVVAKLPEQHLYES